MGITLLHFLVTSIQTIQPKLRNFVNEFMYLPEAASIEENVIFLEMTRIKTFMERIDRECQMSVPDSIKHQDAFKEKMAIFYAEKKEVVVACEQQMTKLKDNHKRLTQLFGESETMPMDEFFEHFN